MTMNDFSDCSPNGGKKSIRYRRILYKKSINDDQFKFPNGG